MENVYDLTESEVIESTTATSDLVESGIVDTEYVEREFGSEVVAGTTESMAVEETTETGTTETGTAGMTKDEMMETETTRTEATETESATAAGEGTTETEGETVSLNNHDTGKNVVNRDSEKIGIVAEVEGDTSHVGPNPSFTDRIKAELSIEEYDEDTYPVRVDQIDEVTRTEVRIAG